MAKETMGINSLSLQMTEESMTALKDAGDGVVDIPQLPDKCTHDDDKPVHEDLLSEHTEKEIVATGDNSTKEDIYTAENDRIEIAIPIQILDIWRQMASGETMSLNGHGATSNREDTDELLLTACKEEELTLTLLGKFIKNKIHGNLSSSKKYTLLPPSSDQMSNIKLDSQKKHITLNESRKRGRPRKSGILIKDDAQTNLEPRKGKRGRKARSQMNNLKRPLYSEQIGIEDPVQCEQSSIPCNDNNVSDNCNDVIDSDNINGLVSPSPQDINDFSDWEATDKKFKKKRKAQSNRKLANARRIGTRSIKNESSSDLIKPKAKDKVKLGHFSDRQMNKSLYSLNLKVAKDMNFDISDEGQVCIICGKSTKLNWNLLVHLRRFHMMERKEYFEILKCSPEDRKSKLTQLRTLQSKPDKVHAPKMAGSLPCSYCGENILGIRNMKRHLQLLHRRERDFDEKVAFFTKEYAKLIHRNRMMASRKENLKKTEYPCRYCGLVLSMSCTRSRHQMYTCSLNPNKKKRVHCSYCGTAFIRREDMEKHVKQHAAHDFKYVCDVCGKESKTKALMYEHKLKEHSGNPPRYTCGVCNKGFHYKDQLKKHCVTHSDLREVMCDYCGKMFKTATDVQKHMKLIHERRYPFHCDICGHGVSKRSYLKSHKCGRVRRRKEDTTVKPNETINHSTSGDLIANNEVVFDVNSNVEGEEIIYTNIYMKNEGQNETQMETVENVDASQYLVTTNSVPTVADQCYSATPIEASHYVTVDQTDQTNYVIHTLQPHHNVASTEYQTHATYVNTNNSNLSNTMFPMYNQAGLPVPQTALPQISDASYMSQMLPVPQAAVSTDCVSLHAQSTISSVASAVCQNVDSVTSTLTQQPQIEQAQIGSYQ